MSKLDLTGLRKSYGQKTVLHDIGISVPHGSFCALLGPSGSGKTTILNIVAGLEPLDAGTVRLGDRDISTELPERRNIGVVFQSYALFPHLSVADNVAYGLKSRKVSKPDQRRRVADMLELVGLSEFHARKPAQLSGGQQQRVALARALVIEPDLLLLDEPLSALDRKVRGEMQREIARIQRETAVTTVMVTHDQEEALSLADQVVLLDEGHVQQRDTPERMYREPASPKVADFMGGQVFDGHLRREGGASVLEVAGLRLDIDAAGYEAPDGDVHVVIASDAVGLVPVDDPVGPATAMVRRVTFMGPTAEVVVGVEGFAEVRALMLSNSAGRIAEGGSVRVEVQPIGLRLWPRGG